MAGDPVGPLAGVPFGIKDLVCTKGIRTTSGSYLYQDFIPDEDDVVVERLRGRRGRVLGKTNVPELGYSGAGHNMSSRDAQPVEHRAHLGRLQRRIWRGGGSRDGTVRNRQRRWRLHPHPGVAVWPLWLEGVDGPGAALPRYER